MAQHESSQSTAKRNNAAFFLYQSITKYYITESK